MMYEIDGQYFVLIVIFSSPPNFNSVCYLAFPHLHLMLLMTISLWLMRGSPPPIRERSVNVARAEDRTIDHGRCLFNTSPLCSRQTEWNRPEWREGFDIFRGMLFQPDPDPPSPLSSKWCSKTAQKLFTIKVGLHSNRKRLKRGWWEASDYRKDFSMKINVHKKFCHANTKTIWTNP